MLELLGKQTEVKKWLAASLDKTIRLQLTLLPNKGACLPESFVLGSGGRGKEVLRRPHFVTVLKTVEGKMLSIRVYVQRPPQHTVHRCLGPTKLARLPSAR
ncbi:MAG: hypothetical protein KJ768_11670, partial [Acidobacteria bacterium]|nr:hypothetical protein [Acidobacteriota bacterium]